MDTLHGKKIAILVADGFEQVELTDPRQALEDAGADTYIVSIKEGTVKGWDETDWGETFTVDMVVDETSADTFDGLLLPGGQMNPDFLRANEKAVAFVKQFAEQGKPIAAICHGPWTLVEADLVRDRLVTSYSSIQTDLKNAGANWVDQEVVVDHGLITSRKPADIPAFNQRMIEEFAKADVHA